MTPLFANAGWGGTVETFACTFLCAQGWIVGLALAGAVFRSPVEVGLSFVSAVAVAATIELSGGSGCAVLAITLLAPLAATVYIGTRRPDLGPPDDTAVERPTEVVDRETEPFPAGWGQSGSAIFRFAVGWLLALHLLLFGLLVLATLSR